MLQLAKSRLAGVSKDLADASPLVGDDPVVEIFEGPVKVLRQRASHTRLPRAHEADENHGAIRITPARSSPGKQSFPRNRILLGTISGSVRSRGPAVRIAFLRYCDFAARFLRWILPLKLRRTTVDETAARPIVPMKVRPCWKVSQE